MNRSTFAAVIPLALLLGACTSPPAASTAVTDTASGGGPDHCQYSEARQLTLDLQGITAISLEVGPDTLVLNGQPAPNGQLSGRACASSAGQLAGLQIIQERQDDTLTVRLQHPDRRGISLGKQYAWLDLAGSIPANMPVRLALGSGDVTLADIAALTAQVGSGDLLARSSAGAVALTLGSGDVTVERASQLQATIGSGELTASAIDGAVSLTVGSGDAALQNIGGLNVQALGSGDVQARQVNGPVSIGSVGSGQISLEAVTGLVHAQSIASGSLQVTKASGDLRVDVLGSGNVTHTHIGGSVQLPRNP